MTCSSFVFNERFHFFSLSPLCVIGLFVITPCINAEDATFGENFHPYLTWLSHVLIITELVRRRVPGDSAAVLHDFARGCQRRRSLSSTRQKYLQTERNWNNTSFLGFRKLSHGILPRRSLTSSEDFWQFLQPQWDPKWNPLWSWYKKDIFLLISLRIPIIYKNILRSLISEEH